MSQYTTADAIVKQSLIETGSTTEHGYQVNLNYFFRVLKDLQITTIKEIKTVNIPLNPNMSIDLPTDSLGWIRVGILGEDNCIAELVQNPKMGLFQKTDSCGNNVPTVCKCEDENTIVDFVYSYEFYNNWGYRWALNSFGGINKPNKAGSFRENRETDQLFIDTETEAKDIYLEYVSNGVNDTGETRVLAVAEEAILAGIYMKKIMRNDKVIQSEKDRAERIYQLEKRKLAISLNSFTIRDFLFTLIKGYILSPK